MTLSSQQLARALFEIAQKENKLDSIASEFEVAQALHLELGDLLKNPKINEQEKIVFLVQNGFNNITANFLLIITKQAKIHQLQAISNYFKDLVNAQSNSLEVEITTKSVLENAQLENIKKTLSDNLQKNIILKSIVDPEILGGIKIKIGDDLIDNSLGNKLRQMKTNLIR